MSIQILNIVLYNHSGDQRILPLHPGRLNIITGASKTGKTALIPIINYCMGSDECHIPAGIIRRAVAWIGLQLQLLNGQAFIARKMPDRGAQTSPEIFYSEQNEISIPEFADLRQTTNNDAIVSLLTRYSGIAENLNEPSQGQTRRPLTANFRHGLFFCFQHQTEVTSNRYLFHRQGDPFIPQTIKDILPYFLGAVDDDHVARMAQLRRLKQSLRGLERQMQEHESIRGPLCAYINETPTP